jgi:hypothetical protein
VIAIAARLDDMSDELITQFKDLDRDRAPPRRGSPVCVVTWRTSRARVFATVDTIMHSRE